jgi:hypothetical protein
VDCARRHQRLLAASAFGLLSLVAELLGRALTYRLDVGRHVATPSYAGAEYYPVLLAAVKVGIALMLARLAWRFVRARATARAGRRLLVALGAPQEAVPRPRLVLSPRLWAGSFISTSLFYLVQTDAERVSVGRWPLLAPWLHTSALPVFAVLAVAVALVYGAVARWFSDYESYAEATFARARRLAESATVSPPTPRSESAMSPRRLFGLAFESRPPPLAA